MQNYSNQELAHMNHDQLSALVHQLPAPLEWNQSWTDKQKLLQRKIDCLHMIDANLVYGDQFWQKQHKWNGYYAYADAYIQQLGKKNVDELYNARKNYFHHHVQINTNVYTDADDVSYHSIKEY